MALIGLGFQTITAHLSAVSISIFKPLSEQVGTHGVEPRVRGRQVAAGSQEGAPAPELTECQFAPFGQGHREKQSVVTGVKDPASIEIDIPRSGEILQCQYVHIGIFVTLENRIARCVTVYISPQISATPLPNHVGGLTGVKVEGGCLACQVRSGSHAVAGKHAPVDPDHGKVLAVVVHGVLEPVRPPPPG